MAAGNYPQGDGVATPGTVPSTSEEFHMSIVTADPSELTGTWVIDPSHTTVEFVARHLMITKVRGTFTDIEGTVEISENPLESSVSATVKLASISTTDAKRDEHLRSADFFDVEKNPEMTFRSTNIKDVGDNRYILEGDLTVNGITRTVAFDVEFSGANKDPWGGTRAAFTAKAEVDRTDWGLTWNVALETGGVLVSNKVQIEVEVELVKQEESASDQ